MAGLAAEAEQPKAKSGQGDVPPKQSNLVTLQDQVERHTGHRPTEQELRIGISVATDGANVTTFKLEEPEPAKKDDQNFSTEGIVHGPKAAFMIAAPKGWLLDNQSGQLQGLPCVLYPEGFNYENTQVEMYAKISSPEYPNAEEFAAWAIDQMKQQPQGLQHIRIENGETSKGYPYFINEYRRECGYDRVERVAYVQLPDAVAYIVLTAVGEALFTEHKDALNEAVQSLLYMPSFIGFEAKMRDALQGQK